MQRHQSRCNEPIEYSVISHTHWDREWYQPFEVFRLQLIDLIDRLLLILEADEQFVFHLDAQTIILTDYLVVRPEAREQIRHFVTRGRLLIGPWFVQSDFFLTSGESWIRNLLIGIREAGEFGTAMMIGYMPDQFGLPSQIPQLLKGFGIEYALFGRGFDFFEANPPAKPVHRTDVDTEFWWESPDTSRVFAVHMATWYNNAQRFPSDVRKAVEIIERIEKGLGPRTRSGMRLCMNGVDHLEPQEDLRAILDAMNETLAPERVVRQRTLPDWFDITRKRTDANRLQKWQGELRNGDSYQMLANTASTRVHLKQWNARLQWDLEGELEPLMATYVVVGADELYPGAQIEYCWKLLLENHAHDSICGCSRDEVHRHMEDRFERLAEVISVLRKRALDDISFRMLGTNVDGGYFTVTVFNLSQLDRSGWVNAVIDIPVSLNWQGFELSDQVGSPIAFLVKARERVERSVFSPINLPGSVTVDRYTVEVRVPTVPMFGARTFLVSESPSGFRRTGHESMEGPECRVMNQSRRSIENDRYIIFIDEDNSISMTDKATGAVFPAFIEFYDEEDEGDSYVHRNMTGEQISATQFLRTEKAVTSGLSGASLKLRYSVPLPTHFDRKIGRRAAATRSIVVTVEVTLSEASDVIRVRVQFRNRVRDHRFRVRIRTGIDGECLYASSPFAMERRDLSDPNRSVRNGDAPTSGIIAVSDGRRTFGVVTNGLHEYEHLNNRGEIALTIMRANGNVFKFDHHDAPVNEVWRVPENQMLRGIDAEFGISLASSPMNPEYWFQLHRAFSIPLFAYVRASDEKTFSGGRPAVQNSEIDEVFFRERPYLGTTLPAEYSLIRVSEGVTVSTLKRTERGDGLVVRLVNPHSTARRVTVSFFHAPKNVFRVSLDERRLTAVDRDNEGTIRLTVAPHEIASIEALF